MVGASKLTLVVIPLVVLVVVLSPLVGVIPFQELMTEHPEVLWQMRVPRVLLALTVGAALALLGVVYQAMFRNPLASPYTLGVSAGAALGTGAVVLLGGSFAGAKEIAATGGAVALVIALGMTARSLRGDEPTRLLLAGLMLNFLCGSLLLFIQYVADFSQGFRLARWLMGSVETLGYVPLMIIVPVMVCVFVVLRTRSVAIQLISMGSDFAAAKGVDVTREFYLIGSVTSVLLGVIVAFCGPIGFVGVAVPFVTRALFSHDVKTQMTASMLVGGGLLTACDTFARWIIAPAEIPVGVITALVGAPFVLFILRKKRD